MNKVKIKSFLPDALAVVLFILIGFVYFFKPMTEGQTLSGHDHTGGVGSGVEMQEYQQRTGERTRWTNALFGGMPTYQMAPSYDSTDLLKTIGDIYHLARCWRAFSRRRFNRGGLRHSRLFTSKK